MEGGGKSYTKGWAFILLAFIVILTVTIIPGFSQSLHFNLELSWSDYSSLLTALLFISLIVERSIEVFVAATRDKEKVRRQQEIETLEAQSIKLHDTIYVEARNNLNEYRHETSIYTLRLGLIIGLVLGLAGILILNELFDASDLHEFQKSLFKAVDIFLTAGLIAGGSKGINAISSLFSSYIQSAQKNKAGTQQGTNNPL